METLEKLFGSSARVKILKLFLLNTDEIIEKKEVEVRAKVTGGDALKELNLLEKIGLVHQRSFFKEKENGGKKMRKKGYIVDKNHRLFIPLQSLLIKNSPMSNTTIISRISRHGKIKLIITSGIFIQDQDSRVDLLIVGDEVKDRSVKSTISVMESEIGKQIRFSIFSTDDFKYRMGVCDRLVRDILDYPHEVILDRIGL
jgi:hypothetical protein